MNKIRKHLRKTHKKVKKVHKFLTAKVKHFLFEILELSIAGTIGYAFHLLLLLLLTEFFGIHYLISNVIGFFTGTSICFMIDKVMIFHEIFKKQFWKEYFEFISVSITTLIISTVLLFIFTDLLGIYYIFSSILASVLKSIVVYFGIRFWVFRKHKFRK